MFFSFWGEGSCSGCLTLVLFDSRCGLTAVEQGLVVRNPFARREFCLRSLNYRQLRLLIYRLRPKKDLEWLNYVSDLDYREDPKDLKQIAPCGELLVDTIIPVSDFQ